MEKKKKLILTILKYLLFLVLGIGLFLWVYRDQDMHSLWAGLSEFHYGWIVASLGIALLSHFLRALRWRMLLDSIGYKPGVLNVFLSILVMYLANFAAPRMGEVTRCGILTRYEKIPFTAQLGTVVIERMVDVVLLLLIIVSVLLFDWNVLTDYLSGKMSVPDSGKYSFLTSWWFLTIVALLVILGLLAVLFRKPLLRTNIAKKIVTYVDRFVEGLKSILLLKKPGIFILLTLGIYACYYMMTWFVMIAFSPTAQLSPFVALAVLAMGSVGMVLPAQGGIGTYHTFVVATLTLYGTSEYNSTLLAFVLHGSTSVFLIFIGAIALIILPIVNPSKKPV
jgi:glycosyltransferase 2 family protein